MSWHGAQRNGWKDTAERGCRERAFAGIDSGGAAGTTCTDIVELSTRTITTRADAKR